MDTYVMRTMVAISALAAAIFLACPASAATTEKLVYKVDSVAARIVGRHLVVDAAGATRTGGWVRARLRPRKGHVPESHTLTLEFVARPPSPKQVVIQEIVPIKARAALRVPYATTRVEVVTETNSIMTQTIP